MGGPTHAFSMSRTTTRQDSVSQGAKADPTFGLREWLDNLPDSQALPFAAFDTRVEIVRRLPGSAAKAAAKVARSHGHHRSRDPRASTSRMWPDRSSTAKRNAPASGAYNSPSYW